MPSDPSDILTPSEIQTLRESYGLSPVQFSKLMGVSLTTIYRWEALSETLDVRTTKELAIEPMQRQLIKVLDGIESTTRAQVGVSIAVAMLNQSTLPMYPLYTLLRAAFTAKPAKAA